MWQVGYLDNELFNKVMSFLFKGKNIVYGRLLDTDEQIFKIKREIYERVYKDD